ncbi:hypothetical protein EON83_17605 [bacterium]|nr:MAG: hypothetical protein EON83_17605 [bacterium]
MRTALIAFTPLLLAVAAPAIAQDTAPNPITQTYSVRAVAEPVKDVLTRLFEEAKVQYRIGDGVIGTVTLDAQGLSLADALDRVAKTSTPTVTIRREGDTYVVSQVTTILGEENVPEYFRARRISDADFDKKKEGQFFTFLPDFSSDPVYGNGTGARANIFWNGKKEDPRFRYTPYVAKLSLNAFVTDKDAQEFAASLDMPYFKNSRFRLKADLKISDNPNNIYFGITERTLGKLTLPDGRTFDKYTDFDKARSEVRPGGPGEAPLVTDSLSNRFREKEAMLNLKADYALGKGKLKLMGGYELQKLNYSTFTGRLNANGVPNGQSVLERDAQLGIAKGIEGGMVSILQQALIYDTRDFEPDPTKGLYLELANEYSSPTIGSDFSFDKLFAQARFYHKLPFGQRTVFAGRLATGNIFGRNAPFFEYQDQWSPDGSINSLGGSDSLRGYVANRYLARAVFFANAELRYRVGETKLLGQRFSLNVSPFLDLGTVRDNWFDINFKNMKVSYGTGIRIGWNQSTMISADFGFSKEGKQFFLGIGQQF